VCCRGARAVLDLAPVIRVPLIGEVPDAGDHDGAMALPLRPSDRFILGAGGVQHAIGMVFDNIAGDRGMRIAALGARFNVNLGHLFCSLRCMFAAPRVVVAQTTLPGGPTGLWIVDSTRH
jgi:hypothetical protein